MGRDFHMATRFELGGQQWWYVQSVAPPASSDTTKESCPDAAPQLLLDGL
jgi:hypothetical protein